MHPHLPIDKPKESVYLFVLEAPKDQPYTKGNVLELRGPLVLGGVHFEQHNGDWRAGGKMLGRRRRLRWDGWGVLFWVGAHDAPALREELRAEGILPAA